MQQAAPKPTPQQAAPKPVPSPKQPQSCELDRLMAMFEKL
jgi:hypothetical protein